MPDVDWNLVHCHQPRAKQLQAARMTSTINAGLRRRVVDTLRRYSGVGGDGPPTDACLQEGGTIAARGRGEMENAPALGAGARKSLRVRLPPPALPVCRLRHHRGLVWRCWFPWCFSAQRGWPAAGATLVVGLPMAFIRDKRRTERKVQAKDYAAHGNTGSRVTNERHPVSGERSLS